MMKENTETLFCIIFLAICGIETITHRMLKDSNALIRGIGYIIMLLSIIIGVVLILYLCYDVNLLNMLP